MVLMRDASAIGARQRASAVQCGGYLLVADFIAGSNSLLVLLCGLKGFLFLLCKGRCHVEGSALWEMAERGVHLDATSVGVNLIVSGSRAVSLVLAV